MWITAIILGLLGVNVVLLVVLLVRKADDSVALAVGSIAERTERNVREEFARNRDESGASAREQRIELTSAVQGFGELVLARMTDVAQLQQTHFEGFARQLGTLTASNEERLEAIRTTVREQLGEVRTDAGQQHALARGEATSSLKSFGETLLSRINETATFQKLQLEGFATNFQTLSHSNEQRLEAMRATVERKLGEMQQDNTQKLEQMRATVDEKLHATLEQRLGESFKLVSERLEQVHAGLGEMRTLATDVGGLQKVLTNIKTRGCWGEVQLGNILGEILTPDQFAKNVATNPRSNERVEFAVKLPGRETDGTPVWLPIDAKFPQEEYQRLLEAKERGNLEGAEQAGSALETSVKHEAKKIADKYLNPPHTTEFGIMFLPTEGLYAEILNRPGLCEWVQRQHVMLSGPTNLAAMLSSLQMGFRTLAIEKRSSEVWNVLGGVKTEFGKFGAALEKVKKKLHEATNTIDDAARRSRVVERKLRNAEALPAPDAPNVVDLESLLPDLGESVAPAEE